jgi:hypothetical protein
MNSLDDVFNLAVDYGVDGVVPAGAPVGMAKLSHVLRVFNAMMSGGLGFAIEVIEPDEFERAVEGFRYLDLPAAADLLADLVDSYGSPDYDERKEDALSKMMNQGDPVYDAFRRKVDLVPSDFGV